MNLSYILDEFDEHEWFKILELKIVQLFSNTASPICHIEVALILPIQVL